MRDRNAKLKELQDNYAEMSGRVPRESRINFHIERIGKYLGRFGMLVSHFGSSSSQLLDHDIFLCVEAAASIAARDVAENGSCDIEPPVKARFQAFFDALDQLKSGTLDLRDGVDRCQKAFQPGF